MGWVCRWKTEVSCTANHLKEEEFFNPLFQKIWDYFLLFSSLVPPFWQTKDPKRRMRQLRGKPKKETSKDKKERKQAMQEARQQITTVVLPTLAVVVLLIVVFVYVATRPNTTE
ncbi:single-pass membrane and coiled-coil domain-containing protein 4 isoform X1 [Falco rusticolus]|uniref:single-pass membrane and coiled-coil domain-containing protein 4 isoform X1 n=1 Tax=Falco rusticolus TaxID=120794 RepID=UPI000FFC61D5|nr:single-pass membrane and coiled-coil domain-containing protein 4 isoform X1 [Falco rusticolus]